MRSSKRFSLLGDAAQPRVTAEKKAGQRKTESSNYWWYQNNKYHFTTVLRVVERSNCLFRFSCCNLQCCT